MLLPEVAVEDVERHQPVGSLKVAEIKPEERKAALSILVTLAGIVIEVSELQ